MFNVRHIVDLHASLRAATILERRYGFQGLVAACADGNLGVIAEIVECSSNCRDFLSAIDGVPFASFMPELLAALDKHIQALAGIDPDTEPERGGETMPFKDYHARLFRIATGWLQWSPADAWNATPKEILDAYSGHLEMLKAIYGGPDNSDQQNRLTDRPENAVFDRAAFQQLRLMAM